MYYPYHDDFETRLQAAKVALHSATARVEISRLDADACVERTQGIKTALRPAKGITLEPATYKFRIVTDVDLREARKFQSAGTRRWLKAIAERDDAQLAVDTARQAKVDAYEGEAASHTSAAEADEVWADEAYVAKQLEVVAAADTATGAAGRPVSSFLEDVGDGVDVIWFWPSEIDDPDAQAAVALGIDGHSRWYNIIDADRKIVDRAMSMENAIQVVGRSLASPLSDHPVTPPEIAASVDNLATKPAGVRYISLFSGMEAASAALERIGCPCMPLAFADTDAAASAVLAHKWPDIPNHGDVTSFDWSVYRGQVDVCFGGSPCQPFSVAGKRLGITEPRGNLALHYLRVVAAVRPRWFLYENVPGFISSGGGDDFKTFLSAVEEIGYSCSWRIVDARYCGVPQRRRRCWVVGFLAGGNPGAWAAPATVLLEPSGKGRDPLEGATAWKSDSGRAGAGFDGGLNAFNETGAGWWNEDSRASGMQCSTSAGRTSNLVAETTHPTHGFSARDHLQEIGINVSPIIRCGSGEGGRGNTSVANAEDVKGPTAYGQSVRGRDGGATAEIMSDVAHSLRTGGGGASSPMAMYVADARHCTISKTETMTLQAGSKVGGQSLNTVPLAVIYDMRGSGEDLCPTLLRGCAGDRLTDYTPGVEDTWRPNDSQPKWIVRRLTPLECIRLQGFPDTWLDGVTLRGKPLADSHKYKLAGNSWAVPCASFIASRIRAWDRLYVGRMLMAAKEVEYAGLVVYGTAEWGVAGFHGDEALLGALFVDDDGYRVIDRDGQTPPGFDAVPLTLGECLALIAAVIVSQAAA